MALRASPLPSPRPQFLISAFLQRRGPLVRLHLVPPCHAEPHVCHISVCVAFAHRRIVRPFPLGVGPVLFLSAVRQQHRRMRPTREPYPDAHGAVPIDQMDACRLGSICSRASAWESGRRPAGEGAPVFLGAVGRAVLRTEAFYEAGEGRGTGDEAGEGRGTGDEAGEGRGTHGVAGEGE